METNKTKEVKVSNTPGASIRTIDELNNQGKKLITKLNPDCLAKVLMHLPVLERLEMEKVCQKWEEAVDLSWYNVKKLELDDLMITLDKKDETLKMIMIKCGRFLRHLTIIDDQYPWMSYVLKDNCKNITNFSIDMKKIRNEWKISAEDLVEIIGSMQKLKYLKVEMNLAKSCDLAHKIVNKLSDDIQEIHLITNSRCIAPVLERFKGLHCLSLHTFSLTNKTLESILQNKNTLTKLDLTFCAFPSDASPIFENLKNIEHLNLNLVTNLSVNEVTSIAHNCLKLKHFEFHFLELIGTIDEGIPYSIYRQLKNLNLEHLKIGMIDKFGFEDENLLSGMTENWKQIKHLDLNEGYDFTNDDLQEIPKLNNLEIINVEDADVDSELFIKIANNCLKLKNIDMNMDKLSEAAIFELSNLKKIEKLRFINNNNLTGYLLERIANNCGNLVELIIHSCNNITEDSLIQIGNLKNLKKLNIKGIENVPNAMFFNLKKLEYLSCEDCPSLTDDGIIKVIDNCPKLYYLNLWKTGVTGESLVHASKRKFVFKLLQIDVDSHVKNKYKKINYTPSPYLIVNYR